MTSAYFDTSVLVKNYVQERDSARARELLRTYTFLSSAITPVELMSALVRRKSRRELKPSDMPGILARVRDDRHYWKLLDIGVAVLDRAEEFIQTTQIRALDAIHIASLITFQDAAGIRLPFITSDSRQRDGAERLGIDVFWVG